VSYPAINPDDHKEIRMIPKIAPWLMLFSRTALFFTVQSLFAFAFYLAGSASAWEEGANWWPIAVAAANLVVLALLIRLFKAEGKRYWDIFRFKRQHVKGDLLAVLGVTLLAAPVSYLPNILLGEWLFGSSEATLDLFIRPLPLWAVNLSVLVFPLSQGVTELPTYFGYVMPRFKAQGMQKWLAISLPAVMLGLQHIAVPLLFDIRFITWRALMYIPFAFLLGLAIHWRPRLLPYFVIIHVLMNMSLAPMFLAVAY
jgi:hypothetical protein